MQIGRMGPRLEAADREELEKEARRVGLDPSRCETREGLVKTLREFMECESEAVEHYEEVMASGSADGERSGWVTVNVDGGARGNPGPAAIGAIARSVDGQVVARRSQLIGEATNNVAEYRALLAGVELAIECGVVGLELVSDSQLVVCQVRGEWRVKDAALRELRAEVLGLLEAFESWSIRHVRREENAEADRLVNEALDG